MRAEEALGAAIGYINTSLLGGGAVVGKNVQVSSITPIDGGNRVTFSYTLDDGTPQTSYMDVMDGKDAEKGATEEQAQQIKDNADAIEQLQKDVEDLQDSGGGGSGGTTNYNKLTNKPSINGKELIGNVSLEDVGIKEESIDIDFSNFFS